MTDVGIAKKAMSAMIILGIEIIADEIDGKDFDRCNMLLCKALSMALELQVRVDKVKRA